MTHQADAPGWLLFLRDLRCIQSLSLVSDRPNPVGFLIFVVLAFSMFFCADLIQVVFYEERRELESLLLLGLSVEIRCAQEKVALVCLATDPENHGLPGCLVSCAPAYGLIMVQGSCGLWAFDFLFCPAIVLASVLSVPTYHVVSSSSTLRMMFACCHLRCADECCFLLDCLQS